jgi:hypothetical protein
MSIEEQGNDNQLQFILEEYKSLRTEAQTRMGHRITLLTSNTATSSVLLSLSLSVLSSNSLSIKPSAELLLLVPVTSCLFGLLTAYHTALIYDIGDYIQLIEIRINKMYPLAMGWYTSSNNNQFEKIFWMWHFPMMLITLAPSLVAITLFFLSTPVWRIQTVILFAFDLIMLFYFVRAYLTRIRGRKTHRCETTRQWAEQLSEQHLVPNGYKFKPHGTDSTEKRSKRQPKR